MSLVGQKRRFDLVPTTSRLPRITDIIRPTRHVGKSGNQKQLCALAMCKYYLCAVVAIGARKILRCGGSCQLLR
jgi:hypothetical protein